MDGDHGDETNNLWGYYKVSYTLKDLEKWLDEKQRGADRKERKKVTRSQKGSQRGKDGNDDGDKSSPKKSLTRNQLVVVNSK